MLFRSLHPAWLILVALGLLLAAGLGVITLWRNAPPAPSAAAAPLRYADSSAASGAVQPTMPPWARIMDSVAS